MAVVANFLLGRPAFDLQRALPACSTGTHGLDGPAPAGGRFDRWRRRIRLRGHLARLHKTNPSLIEDIGLTLDEAEREIRKPFWGI